MQQEGEDAEGLLVNYIRLYRKCSCILFRMARLEVEQSSGCVDKGVADKVQGTNEALSCG